MPGSDQSQRYKRKPKPWLIPAGALLGVVALAAAVGGAFIASYERPRDPRAGSRALGANAAPVPIVRSPASYHIVYRGDGGGGLVTEEMWVTRPFRSRVETRAGGPPGGATTAQRTAVLGRIEIDSAASDPAVLAIEATVAPDDARFDAALSPVIASGLMEARERRSVLNRPCQVYRSLTRPNGSELEPIAAGVTSYTDTCVDGAGLIVEQLDVIEGNIVSRKVATMVGEAAGVPDDFYMVAITPTQPARMGGAAFVEISATAPSGGITFALPAAPVGFDLLGRFAVVGTQMLGPEGVPTSGRLAAIADVYTRGPDMVVFEQGGSSDGSSPFSLSPSALTVTVGAAGDGQAIPSLRGSEVRAIDRTNRSRFVRISGTIPLTELIALAATVTRT